MIYASSENRHLFLDNEIFKITLHDQTRDKIQFLKED